MSQEQAISGAEHLQLRLDDKTVEAKTEAYPQEAREHARWLAGFVRERCARQLSVLVENVKKLGFKSDYSYWHKILTGKYFGPDPDRPGKTVGSVSNFVQIMEELRKGVRLNEQAGRPPFIETPTWDMINDFVTMKRQPGRVNKFGGIVGPTGSQKSACFREYQSRNNHGKVVHIEAPERPRMGQFLTDLARAYGESATKTGEKKISAITEAVNETKCIIVDNVQRLYKDNRGGDQPIFNFLQKLQDDTGCTIIFSYTPDFTRVLSSGADRGYFEQFIGRMGGLKKVLALPDFAPAEDLLCIARAYKLKDAEKHVKYLDSMVRQPGRIRAFFEDLQDAKAEAVAAKEELTIAHLKMVRGEEDV